MAVSSAVVGLRAPTIAPEPPAGQPCRMRRCLCRPPPRARQRPQLAPTWEPPMTVRSLGIRRGPRQEPGGLGQLRRRTSSACSASTRAARRWRSAWTTASSGWWSTPTAGRASASSAGRWRTPPPSMRSRRGWRRMGTKVARGSRALADERHVRICGRQRSGRQPARVLPWRRDRIRSVQARPQHLRLPHRPARHGPRGDALRAHRRRDDVLPGGAGVQAQRLLAAAVPRLLLPRQPAPPHSSRWSRPARTWSTT